MSESAYYNGESVDNGYAQSRVYRNVRPRNGENSENSFATTTESYSRHNPALQSRNISDIRDRLKEIEQYCVNYIGSSDGGEFTSIYRRILLKYADNISRQPTAQYIASLVKKDYSGFDHSSIIIEALCSYKPGNIDLKYW